MCAPEAARTCLSRDRLLGRAATVPRGSAPCFGARVAMEKGLLARAFSMMISLAFPVAAPAPRSSPEGLGVGRLLCMQAWLRAPGLHG